MENLDSVWLLHPHLSIEGLGRVALCELGHTARRERKSARPVWSRACKRNCRSPCSCRVRARICRRCWTRCTDTRRRSWRWRRASRTPRRWSVPRSMGCRRRCFHERSTRTAGRATARWRTGCRREERGWSCSRGTWSCSSETFLERFQSAMINVHPSLLPAFPGLGAIEQALAYGVKVFGVTVHFVDAGVDSGPVISQRAVELQNARDPEEVLKALTAARARAVARGRAAVRARCAERRSREPAADPCRGVGCGA